MARKVAVGFVKGNTEVKKFVDSYKPIIYRACHDAGLGCRDWDVVLNTMAIKYAEGRFGYDPSRGVKPTTYAYMVASCRAKDEIRRQHPERFTDVEDKDRENIADKGDNYAQMNRSDEMLIVCEALRRMVRLVHDKTKPEMLVRYVINGESREGLASEFGVTEDYVSLVKNRYLPRLQALVREVWQEDAEGRLNLSSTDISFLKAYIN